MIIGYDPGTTGALAVLDLKGEVLMLVTLRGGFKQATELLTPFKPIIIASDKPFMESVQKLATFFRATAFFPKKDLTLQEKSELTKAYKTVNQHEKDALASALYVYKNYRSTIRKVLAKEHEIFRLLIEKKPANLKEMEKTGKSKPPKSKNKDVELIRRVKDLKRKLEIAENLIKEQETELEKIKEERPNSKPRRKIILSKGLKEEKMARLRLEKELSAAHSRLTRIETRLKKMEAAPHEEKEDIRGWVLNMIKEYKKRFRK